MKNGQKNRTQIFMFDGSESLIYTKGINKIFEHLNINICLGFEVKLASFYHSSMVELSEQIDKCLEDRIITREESIQYTKLLQLARHRTITSFRQVK